MSIAESSDEQQSKCTVESIFGLSTRIIRFRATLNEESDRGCALMAASYLDDGLGELLKSVYVDEPAIANESIGRLTFSDAISQAYLLGLLSERAKHDLNLIRKIRNEFAHSADVLDFSYQPIVDRCMMLYHASEVSKKLNETRSVFTSAALSVAAQIFVTKTRQQHKSVPESINYSEKSEAASFAPLLVYLQYKELVEEAQEKEDLAVLEHWQTMLDFLVEMLEKCGCSFDDGVVAIPDDLDLLEKSKSVFAELMRGRPD